MQQQNLRPNKNAKKSIGNSKKKKSVSEAPETKENVKSESNNNNSSNKSVSRREKNKGTKVDKLNAKEKAVIPDPPVKLERAKTFVFGNKLNKVINKLTGSRESLNKIDETPRDDRFSLRRSLTISSISIKRNNRKSIREPVLEELKEDTILEKVTNDQIPPVSVIKQRSASIFEPPPFKRSGSFIDRLRNKLSSGKPSQGNLSRNSWSESLQSLQSIDTMVKYDDLKFVNYDLFNTYEQRIDQKLNSLNASQTDLVNAVEYRTNGMGKRYPSSASLKSFDSINATIRVRPKKRISFNMNIMDEEKNLYRQSLDVGSINNLSGRKSGMKKRESIGEFQNEEEYLKFLQESFRNDVKEETYEVEQKSVDIVDFAHQNDGTSNEMYEEKHQENIKQRSKSLPSLSEVVENEVGQNFLILLF